MPERSESMPERSEPVSERNEPVSERNEPVSERNEPWDDIETLYDAVRVEEEVLLAVMEVLGQLDDSEADEFSWDHFGWALAYGATSQ
ncbi:MAG: hypothetical protein IID07_11230 [Gemmatimonadetes bacterium]|nr:hypothetical protein [Gemmatimonadota bacterium]